MAVGDVSLGWEVGRKIKNQGPGAPWTDYAADPTGEWSAPALLSALRLEWRSGNEASAATLFYILAGRPEWNAPPRLA